MRASELMADVLPTCLPDPLATKSLTITVSTQTAAWIGRRAWTYQ